MAENPVVGIVLGSKSDEAVAEEVRILLAELGINFETLIRSAHRNPVQVAFYAGAARERGLKVLIGIAGLAAALPGVLAAHTTLPVIGVPVPTGPLNGLDALYAIVQMPPGIPVATVGIGNGRNAALLAAAILAVTDPAIQSGIEKIRAKWNNPQS